MDSVHQEVVVGVGITICCNKSSLDIVVGGHHGKQIPS